MTTLSADLVPFIGRASVLLARLAGLKVSEESADSSQSGTVTLEVFEVFEMFAGEEPRVGDSIAVPFERRNTPELRFRNPANHWNKLALQEGDLLVSACRRDGDWTVLAARQVESATCVEVDHVRRCCAIERSRGPVEALQEALSGGKSILRAYAFEGLTERGIVPREAAAEMLERAIESRNAAPRERVDLADRFVSGRLFDPERSADPTNRRVVGTLARGLVRDADSEFRGDWIDLIEYCLRREAIRTALVRSVPADVSTRVLELLHEAASDTSKGDPATAEALFNIWTLE